MLDPPAWAKNARNAGCRVEAAAKVVVAPADEPEHANAAIAPGLGGDPVERVMPVRGVVGVDPVLALRAVPAAAILVHRGIAMLDDGLPAAQDRAAHRLGRVRQPGMAAIEFVARVGGGD